MLLYGYGPQLLAGTWETIKLAMLSLLVSLVLGLLAALMKLSRAPLLRLAGGLYTTLIRGIPDLVLLMLFFFSLQIWLNDVTDWLEVDMIEIDPFGAGVVTLGFIYGAYFAETFRGALLAIPKGQIEAGKACGWSPLLILRRIQIPQMMRYALPGLGNNWQVLLKSTALVSLIGLSDVVKVAQNAGNATFNTFLFVGLTALIYLALTAVSNVGLRYLERRYNMGVRGAEF
ncbi:ABC transporter permease [Alcaligenes sp. SDU_A2]|uniref:ABC transporter permease n=1 Tax=Alcaligenes sp. SDU_A2 TaxID=3136634 RepID=UPI002BDDB626|nr:ABC transporter permease [Alcaligenes sp.]HRL26532.1 ABC transporter permease [Alcaligenes sp.]